MQNVGEIEIVVLIYGQKYPCSAHFDNIPNRQNHNEYGTVPASEIRKRNCSPAAEEYQAVILRIARRPEQECQENCVRWPKHRVRTARKFDAGERNNE